jgi:hypothetical protein
VIVAFAARQLRERRATHGVLISPENTSKVVKLARRVATMAFDVVVDGLIERTHRPGL